MKKKVLIIDDNLNTCKEIKYALQSETTDVHYALSAKKGFEQFAKHRFCLDGCICHAIAAALQATF